ncbi:hypothetical protein NONI108955_36785 [Nocardia ninae]|uniref:Uncharacterized protein n=1 Tax=Nocardia ninae NBRC 108245 TaxID=1210091 RepID=A0A511MDU1_9NOCA|nr:hypothetical protein [Nocardia ninae]GEM38651.1 hypothetical protein NN4_31700 [Nocardia ninae NBRC 108245]
MANMTFTVRINPRDHELLTSLAAIRNQSVAELSREILADGIRRLLDPVEIDKRLAIERERLLAAAEQIRGERLGTSAPGRTSSDANQTEEVGNSTSSAVHGRIAKP